MASPNEDVGHTFDEVNSEEPLTKFPMALDPLLTTNHSPTAFQTSQLFSVEHKILADFLRIKNQIDEHEKRLSDLRALQQTQVGLLHKCRSLRSLLRSLPNELLSRIFMECIPLNGVVVSLKMSPREPPMVLCHVCSRWRAIALSTPQLWNRLTATIVSSPFDRTHSFALIKLMLEWFGRAKTLPLSLRFASQITYPSQPLVRQCHEEANVPIHLLTALSPHLSVLDLAMSWAPFLLEYVSRRSEGPHFKKLESLILRRTSFVGTRYSWKGVTPLTPFRSAKRLCKVAMFYPVFAGNSRNMMFPWEQLTHFVVSQSVPHNVLEGLLQSCMNLQQGVFHLTATRYPVPLREVKKRQYLVDLTIVMDEMLNPTILRNFELPELRSLRLGPLFIPDEPWKYRNLLYPHLSTIRRLSFLGGHTMGQMLACERIIELLRYASNVNCLDLCPGMFCGGLMVALAVTAPTQTPIVLPTQIPSIVMFPTPILPKLRTLSIDLGVRPVGLPPRWNPQVLHNRLGHSSVPFSAPEFGRMVKSRWASGQGLCSQQVTRLEELYIYVAKDDEAICVQIKDQLKECMHEGLVVYDCSADILKHWSSRLRDDEVSWPEGLSVLRLDYGCY